MLLAERWLTCYCLSVCCAVFVRTIAVYNQFDTVYYFNSNAKQGELGEYFVDASAGFPSPLPPDFQYNNYLFPLGYKGCDIAL